ncbi:hypothetical protein H0G86_009713 [Trichoderma simmonsii]|uniref:Uncharacterized protein n=1 Tax=Trichoderma simmonsii TaxID=1491479 RepID=A0A8G0LL16_9HYPO|nr:hypothetical protein H0G86_009713 [Trichoderma simmonsii]
MPGSCRTHREGRCCQFSINGMASNSLHIFDAVIGRGMDFVKETGTGTVVRIKGSIMTKRLLWEARLAE